MDLFVMAIAITTFVGSPMGMLIWIGVSSYKEERSKIEAGHKSDYNPSLLRPSKSKKVSLRPYRTQVVSDTRRSKKAG